MKTQAIIIDDESDAQNLVELLLQEMFPQIEVVKKASSVKDAHHFLSLNTVDLIFLDIQLGNENGFDLLDKIEWKAQSKVIFITAYDEYAIKAIKVAAHDYILKPINEEEFRVSVQKTLCSKEEPLKTPEITIGKIALPSLTGLDFVEVDEIIRCEADNNYTLIFFENGEKRMVSKTLSKIEIELSTHGFIRIHHKHLINLKSIQSYSKGSGGGFVVLCNRDTISVSSRRKHILMEAFNA